MIHCYFPTFPESRRGCPEHSHSSVCRDWAAGDDDPPDWRLLSYRLLDSSRILALRDVLWESLGSGKAYKEYQGVIYWAGLGWFGLTSLMWLVG
jgi:hypothetical protein